MIGLAATSMLALSGAALMQAALNARLMSCIGTRADARDSCEFARVEKQLLREDTCMPDLHADTRIDAHVECGRARGSFGARERSCGFD